MNEPVAGEAADLQESCLAETRKRKAAYKREWYAKNREKHQAIQKSWHEKNRELSASKKRAKRKQSPIENLRESVKRGLNRKGGNITADFMFQMWLDQDGQCALSGIKMVWGGGTGPTNMSIDRIDSSKGYFKDNVRLICHAINSFRGKMSDEDLLKMAECLVSKMQAKRFIKKVSQEAIA